MENQVMDSASTQLTPRDPEEIQHYVSSPSAGLRRLDDGSLVAVKGYREDAMLDVLTRPEYLQQWTPIEEFVNLFDGRVTSDKRSLMGARTNKLRHNLLDEDFQQEHGISPMYLARKKNSAGSVMAVKIIRPSQPTEVEFAREELETAITDKTDSIAEIKSAAKAINLDFRF